MYDINWDFHYCSLIYRFVSKEPKLSKQQAENLNKLYVQARVRRIHGSEV